MNQLANKTMLITGASSGFGRAIALACAEAGADVALVARRRDALEEIAAQIATTGGRAAVCPADIADETQIRAAVEQALAELGQIDVLVNTAGTNFPQRGIMETAPAQWAEILNVNLTSAYLFTHLLLPDMIARQAGMIINVSSIAGIHPRLRSGVAYSASKMGMDALNRITNEESNPHRVRACLICPGDSNTPLLDKRPAPPSPEQRSQILQPEDIAQAVVFVAGLPPHVLVEQMTIRPVAQP